LAIYKISSSHFKSVERTDFLGDENRIFYTVDPVQFYLSDGINPGGTPINFGVSEEYVDQRISDLIDGAPDILDTLNELSAAIGDDANFVTTISNALDDKLDAANFETQFDINIATITTDDITEGSTNLYLNGTGTTDDLTEGSTNLYYSDSLVDDYLRSGDIEKIVFDTDHENGAEAVGTLCWNKSDGTLNLFHKGGVVQQIGQEMYAYVRNNTGSTIADGTVVQFAGADMDGEARLEVSPFTADGTFPSLYMLGVATQTIADGADGRVTVWGKVRDINTTGSTVSETWTEGDILYAHPSTAGAFTNVKPTAPNNVIPVAAVLYADATVGEIFVRPTIQQKMSYGRFSRTTDVTVASANTAYTVTFNVTDSANGVTIGTPASRLVVDQSGYYQLDISAQVDVTGGGFTSGVMYVWVRKNGVDVPNTMRRQGISSITPGNTISFATSLSLDVNDYVEIAYAGDDTDMIFDATGATAFGPTTAAVKIGITQIQL
jgi:hypothetical protein